MLKIHSLGIHNRILVIGYGNPGRQDDGLGPTCAKSIQARGITNVCVDIGYQLSVEHALAMAAADTVVFIDAMMCGDAPYHFEQLHSAKESPPWGSHSISPAALLKLTETLYATTPESYLLGIRGYWFDDFEETLSNQAELNLQQAVTFVCEWLETPQSLKIECGFHG